MDISAADLLRSYDTASIQQMARQRGMRVERANRESLIDALVPTVFDEIMINAAVARLADVERLLLNRVMLAGGTAQTATLRQMLQGEGHVDRPRRRETAYFGGYRHRETGTFHNRQSRRFEDIVARLGVLGLLYTADPMDSYQGIVSFRRPGRRLFIPDAVQRLLSPVELPIATVPEPKPDATRRVDPRDLMRDLYHVVSFAGRENIPLTTKGLIVRRSLVRIAGTLQRPDDLASARTEDDLVWLPFVRSLAEELELLVQTSGHLMQGDRSEAFFGMPEGERHRRIFDAYRTTCRWSELYRIPGLRIKGRGGSLRHAHVRVVAARQRILDEIAGLPVATWIPLSHLIDRLRQQTYEMLLPRQMPTTYSLGFDPNPYRDADYLGITFDVDSEASGWNIVEGGMIRVAVTEALHALGVVDIGQTDDGRTAFRVTDTGNLLLNGRTPASVEERTEVIVQPDFQVLAFAPTGEGVLFQLDQIAERVRTGLVMEYELTRDALCRAQQTGRAGFDTTQIVGFLERVSKVGLPQNVRRTLEDWGEQIERVTVRPHVALVETESAERLDALYADPEIASLLVRRVAPAAALVRSEHLDLLAEALSERGMLPALLEGENEQPKDHQV